MCRKRSVYIFSLMMFIFMMGSVYGAEEMGSSKWKGYVSNKKRASIKVNDKNGISVQLSSEFFNVVQMGFVPMVRVSYEKMYKDYGFFLGVGSSLGEKDLSEFVFLSNNTTNLMIDKMSVFTLGGGWHKFQPIYFMARYDLAFLGNKETGSSLFGYFLGIEIGKAIEFQNGIRIIPSFGAQFSYLSSVYSKSGNGDLASAMMGVDYRFGVKTIFSWF
jgi:hypothetical protein